MENSSELSGVDYAKKQPIVELYACLQSEGKLTGVPHILIRTTGCVMRCQFAETDFCDSWYTSWHPEKGGFTLNDIIKFFQENRHIKHTMITGGSPTMHPELLRTLVKIAHEYDHKVTLETEGSRFVEDCPIDLLSLSPKFDNSKPKVGTQTPGGREVTERDLNLHEKHRRNYEAMRKWIDAAKDYQLKPVISNDQEIEELRYVMSELSVPEYMCWLMPAGGTADELQKHRAWLMEFCWQNGFNYTDRIHIVAYNDERGV